MLDRVLDKGLVVAGDIKISLAEVELLTIRIRLHRVLDRQGRADRAGLVALRSAISRRDATALAIENEACKKQIRSLEQRGRRARRQAGAAPAALEHE